MRLCASPYTYQSVYTPIDARHINRQRLRQHLGSSVRESAASNFPASAGRFQTNESANKAGGALWQSETAAVAKDSSHRSASGQGRGQIVCPSAAASTPATRAKSADSTQRAPRLIPDLRFCSLILLIALLLFRLPFGQTS